MSKDAFISYTPKGSCWSPLWATWGCLFHVEASWQVWECFGLLVTGVWHTWRSKWGHLFTPVLEVQHVGTSLLDRGEHQGRGGQTEQADVNRCITNMRCLSCSQLCTSAWATYQNSAPASSLGITISDRDSNRVSHSCISPCTLHAHGSPCAALGSGGWDVARLSSEHLSPPPLFIYFFFKCSYWQFSISQNRSHVPT